MARPAGACELFLRNLPPEASDSDLFDLFASFCGSSSISHVRVVRHVSGVSREFGYAKFHRPEVAAAVQEKFSGQLLEGRFLVIEIAARHFDKRDFLFPFLSPSDRQLILLDSVAEYSVSDAENADSVTRIFREFLPESACVTDAFACVGGNSISFARSFAHVNACELDERRFSFLENNLKVAGVKEKVSAYQGSFLERWLSFDQSGIFFDPPWGGSDYHQHEKIKIFFPNPEALGKEISMGEICRKLADRAVLIALKLPHNFDFHHFLSDSLFHPEARKSVNVARLRYPKMALLIMEFSLSPEQFRASLPSLPVYCYQGITKFLYDQRRAAENPGDFDAPALWENISDQTTEKHDMEKNKEIRLRGGRKRAREENQPNDGENEEILTIRKPEAPRPRRAAVPEAGEPKHQFGLREIIDTIIIQNFWTRLAEVSGASSKAPSAVRSALLGSRPRDSILSDATVDLIEPFDYSSTSEIPDRHQYFVTWKPAGPTFLLVSLKLDNFPYCQSFLIPAEFPEPLAILRIPELHFASPLADGAVLMGELTEDSAEGGALRPRFLASDCLALGGFLIHQWPLLKRIEKSRQALFAGQNESLKNAIANPLEALAQPFHTVPDSSSSSSSSSSVFSLFGCCPLLPELKAGFATHFFHARHFDRVLKLQKKLPHASRALSFPSAGPIDCPALVDFPLNFLWAADDRKCVSEEYLQALLNTV